MIRETLFFFPLRSSKAFRTEAVAEGWMLSPAAKKNNNTARAIEWSSLNMNVRLIHVYTSVYTCVFLEETRRCTEALDLGRQLVELGLLMRTGGPLLAVLSSRIPWSCGWWSQETLRYESSGKQ